MIASRRGRREVDSVRRADDDEVAQKDEAEHAKGIAMFLLSGTIRSAWREGDGDPLATQDENSSRI